MNFNLISLLDEKINRRNAESIKNEQADPDQEKHVGVIDVSKVPNSLQDMFAYLNAAFFNNAIPPDIPVKYDSLPQGVNGMTEVDLQVEKDKNGQMLKDSKGRPVYKVDANGQPIYVSDSAVIYITEKLNLENMDNVKRYKGDLKRIVISVLLHEMVHAYWDTHGKPGEGHHVFFKSKLSDIAVKTGIKYEELLGGWQSDMDESCRNSRIKQLA